MNSAVYIPIFMMLFVLFLVLREQRLAMLKKLIEKRKKEGNTQMKELAERFVGKECLVYVFGGHQYDGTLKEVTDGALLIQKGEKLEAVNLDFVMRLREYPRKKNGKKKSVVID